MDSVSVKDFREIALAQLKEGRIHLVIDFSQVDRVDGQALAGLVSFYRKLTVERKGRLAVSGVNPELRQFLDRTSLSRVIPVCYDWKEALREVRS